jgi:hypothetical protein
VLGLRFFVCAGCGTVYADPEEPPGPGCDCDVPQLSEITGRLGADTYFLPPDDVDGS